MFEKKKLDVLMLTDKKIVKKEYLKTGEIIRIISGLRTGIAEQRGRILMSEERRTKIIMERKEIL